ncbi:MAG: CDP-diacylglycerol--glycerol-3-phosphate 3-phosphatidyltransferase [Cyanobacteria bacterium]|nr:CDP-diacylglycerol--glycerol-3-phosphate 3-phosphatidyltransferase [Cyanobacteriota bacterium]MDA1020500.1 CDP-diacylglycerol--glycerol-3-phosphate 3-phosphatidyltransferase [Cyanobacteriota bacterium]
MKSLANNLTISRIILAPIILLLLVSSQYLYALILFILAALTDYFDGYIARKYEQESQMGGILDPIADKLVIIPCLIFFSCSGLLNPLLVGILASRDIAVTVIRLKDLKKHEVYDKANMMGKLKTVLSFVILSLAMLIHITAIGVSMTILGYIVNALLLLALVLSLSGSLKFLKGSVV